MEIIATIGGKRYNVSVSKPHDISIPIRFEGDGLSAFGASPAHKETYATEGFVGDVKKGGSCNCDVLSFAPHLHGTHTECVGHIAKASIAVCDILKDSLIPATLITVTPQAGSETYIPKLRPSDMVITKDQVSRALQGRDRDFLEALIIRTVPNTSAKISAQYGATIPPFFSREAMQYLGELNIKHLLVDVPSIDRLDDEGKLTNHHIFWQVEQGSHTVDEKNPSLKTITELIYVSDDIDDGIYMLNLQVAPLMVDAASSRPMLYEAEGL
jgi:arylformamidase